MVSGYKQQIVCVLSKEGSDIIQVTLSLRARYWVHSLYLSISIQLIKYISIFLLLKAISCILIESF